MKKLFVILLALTLLLCGCSNSNDGVVVTGSNQIVEVENGADENKEEELATPDFTLIDFIDKSNDEITSIVANLDYVTILESSQYGIALKVNDYVIELQSDEHNSVCQSMWLCYLEDVDEIYVTDKLTTYMNADQAIEILTEEGYQCEFKYPNYSDKYTSIMLAATTDEMTIEFVWKSNDFNNGDTSMRPSEVFVFSASVREWYY